MDANPFAEFVNPIAAPAAPQAAPSSDITSGILSAEGTGQNPRSSAAGPGQFIDSTWTSMIQKYRPDLAAGKTPQQIISMKTDPQYAGVARAMTNAYAAENSEALSNAGFQATPGNVYLAHFAGPSGATSVLKSDPNTPVAQVLGQKVVDANPFLANMTTGQLQQWAASKVGQRPEGFYNGRMHVNISAGPAQPVQDQTNSNPFAIYVQQPQQGVSAPADFLRSIPGGFVSGVGGILSATGQGANLEMARPEEANPTPEQATGAIEQNVTGPLPQPQGVAGQYGRTLGQFGAYALTGPAASPGGVVANVARSVIPAIVSETAGQATSGTPYEGAARMAGAVLAGGRGGASGTMERAAVPTTPELLNAARQGYNSIQAANYAPHVMDNLVGRIEQELRANNARDYLAPGTFRAIQELKDEPTVQGIHNVRSLLGTIGQNGSKFEGRASRLAQEQIDNFLQQTNPEAAQTIKEADANYAAGMRSQKIETAQEIAGLRAGRAGYGGNSVNAMRQVLYPILEKAVKGKTQGLSPEEIGAIRDIVEGTPLTNTLRGGGMFSPAKGAFSLASGVGGGFAVGGPAGAAAVPVLGAAMGKIANVLTSKQIDRLGELIRKRSPLYEKTVAEAANKYAMTSDAFAKSPSAKSFIQFVVASRNLAAGFRKDGINVSSGDLLKQLQGPMPAGADPYEKEVGGKPRQ